MLHGISVLGSITATISSSLFCYFVYAASHFISTTFSASYSQLSTRERIYWRMNTVAWVHALFACSHSVITLILIPQLLTDLVHGNERAPWIDLFVSFSFGYFIYDFTIVVYYYKKLPQLPTIIHHSFVILGILFVWTYQFGTVIVTIALVEDISTVFLYTGFFFQKINMDPTAKLFRINQTLLYTTFPIFRFLYNWYVINLIWTRSDDIQKISELLFYFGMTLFITIGLLNTFWMFRLFYSVELFRGHDTRSQLKKEEIPTY